MKMMDEMDENALDNAAVGFASDQKLYKNNDFRCLKPKPGTPTSKWGHYEMHGYRAAKTKEELSKVMEIPFDKYFYNFEDPDILHAMTDGSQSGLELWKKTYGFDAAYYVPGKISTQTNFKCSMHCLEAEYSKFAENCKRNGGFFKCCVYA